jgi:uncharacterized membrane protein YbhN (UPF0104 family)
MAVLLVGLVSYFGAYLASVLTSLKILWLHDRANAALFVAVAIFVAIVVAIPVGVLRMKQWGQRLPQYGVKRLPGAAYLLRAIAEAPTGLLRHPVLLAETVTLKFAVFALDALTLWLVLRALGDTPAIWVAFVSFIMASMAATLGPIPLGLGTFEAACVGMLSLLGVAIEAASTATLCCAGSPFGYPWCQVCGLPDVRSLRDDYLATLVCLKRRLLGTRRAGPHRALVERSRAGEAHAVRPQDWSSGPFSGAR